MTDFKKIRDLSLKRSRSGDLAIELSFIANDLKTIEAQLEQINNSAFTPPEEKEKRRVDMIEKQLEHMKTSIEKRLNK